jgi:mono/diheme cytochrome c family protein
MDYKRPIKDSTVKRSKRLLALGGAIGLLAGVGLAAAQAPPASDLPPGPGRDELQSGCNACHGLETITARRKTLADWQSTVDSMVSRGAVLTDVQSAVVVAYLAQNFALPTNLPPIPIAPRGDAPAAGAAPTTTP